MEIGMQSINTRTINRKRSDACAATRYLLLPKIEKVYGFGPVPPFEDIAGLWLNEMGKIAPTGLYAQYQLGLTQQIPMNVCLQFYQWSITHHKYW